MSEQPVQPAVPDLRGLRRRGILFVFSGPSGVGKDSVLALYGRDPMAPERVVTATTRPARPGEEHGRDYHFLGEAAFEQLRAEGGLLEAAQVHAFWYGTPRVWVEERLESGRDVIAKIDVQGGRSIRALELAAVSIFVLPPSWAELERRLRGRGTDVEEQVRRRLADARLELAERRFYKYWIVNDSRESAAAALAAIVSAERSLAARWLTAEERHSPRD